MILVSVISLELRGSVTAPRSAATRPGRLQDFAHRDSAFAAFVIQLTPQLIMITVNVIIQLILSILQRTFCISKLATQKDLLVNFIIRHSVIRPTNAITLSGVHCSPLHWFLKQFFVCALSDSRWLSADIDYWNAFECKVNNCSFWQTSFFMKYIIFSIFFLLKFIILRLRNAFNIFC
jgi:hypothetical protein